MPEITLEDVRRAAERIRPHVRKTPVLRSTELDEWIGAELFCKAEHLQEAGAFKSRGACNAVFSLSDEEASRGVVTHSSGNHAAALARAAGLRGVVAHIVMPSSAPAIKVENVERFGGRITFCEPTLEAREKTARRVIADTGATFIHPYDDARIIAGQGTAALELLEEFPDLDAVIAPVGGGGLLSGTIITTKSLSPSTAVWGAEPRGADDAFRSWKSGELIPQTDPRTIADGLLTSLGDLTFPIITGGVDDILLAEEATIREAVVRLLRGPGWRVEPSGCVPLAALRDSIPEFRGRRIGAILSGGNFDESRFGPTEQVTA